MTDVTKSLSTDKGAREDVYAAIDTERNYQEERWERPKHNHSAT